MNDASHFPNDFCSSQEYCPGAAKSVQELQEGDGDPEGDGEGDPEGDGEGEPEGDGDGEREPEGDGDGEGDPEGDGDGEGDPEGDGDEEELPPLPVLMPVFPGVDDVTNVGSLDPLAACTC